MGTTRHIHAVSIEEIEEHYSHVLSNEFMTRKIVDSFQPSYHAKHHCWWNGIISTTGNYTWVLFVNANGEKEEAHFWRMGNKYCYSFQKMAEC